MQKHPQFKSVVRISQIVSDSEFTLSSSHLIYDSIEFSPMKFAIVVLNILHMNIWQFFLFLLSDGVDL